MIVRSLKDRAKKFNVGVVTIATDGAHAERELQAGAAEFERAEPGLITRTSIAHLA